MQDLDLVDQAYITSLIPKGAIATSLMSVVTWIDAETGESRWRFWCDAEIPTSMALGHLEMAKADLMQRTWNGLPCSVDYSRDEDD